MGQINFNSDKDSIEKLRVLAFKTRKGKRELLQEGLNYIIDKYKEHLDE